MKKIYYVIFYAYNIIYQVLLLFCLFFANTFLNPFFIPDSFRWYDHKIRQDLRLFETSQIIILIAEVALLIFILYRINKLYLLKIVQIDNSIIIAKRTIAITFVISLLTIICSFYLIYK